MVERLLDKEQFLSVWSCLTCAYCWNSTVLPWQKHCHFLTAQSPHLFITFLRGWDLPWISVVGSKLFHSYIIFISLRDSKFKWDSVIVGTYKRARGVMVWGPPDHGHTKPWPWHSLCALADKVVEDPDKSRVFFRLAWVHPRYDNVSIVSSLGQGLWFSVCLELLQDCGWHSVNQS